jgi:hypothetical protein
MELCRLAVSFNVIARDSLPYNAGLWGSGLSVHTTARRY